MRLALDVRPIQRRDGSARRGIGRYVRDLAAGLRDHAPEIETVLLRLPDPLPPEMEGMDAVTVRGRTYDHATRPLYLRVPKLRSNVQLYGAFFDRRVREQAEAFGRALESAKADVLHLPGGVDWGGSPTPPLAGPVVRSFLDAIPLRRPKEYFETWGPFLREHYSAEFARFARTTAVVAISNVAADEAHEFGSVPRERLRIIYPAVSSAFRSPIGPTPLGLRRGKYVLFCSAPDAQKNPETAILAFARARLPDEVRLVFVAPTRHPARGDLERLAAENGIADRFLWTGFVSDAEMPPLFGDALALVSPSFEEGFGLPAAQAMTAGTPVIASNRSALAEVVGDAGILAEPDDPDVFAAALDRIHASAELRRELIARGLARAETFTSEAQARALVEVYREALSRAPAESTIRM